MDKKDYEYFERKFKIDINKMISFTFLILSVIFLLDKWYIASLISLIFSSYQIYLGIRLIELDKEENIR